MVKAVTIRHMRPCLRYSAGLRLPCVAAQQHVASRGFSTTPHNQLRDFFPNKDTKHIQTTPAAWPHHGYTMEEMKAVVPAHRKPRGFGDWAAWKIVRIARYWMDKVTGMESTQQVDKKNPTTSITAEKPLTEAQWVWNLVPIFSIRLPIRFSLIFNDNGMLTYDALVAYPIRLLGEHSWCSGHGCRHGSAPGKPATHEAGQRLDRDLAGGELQRKDASVDIHEDV